MCNRIVIEDPTIAVGWKTSSVSSVKDIIFHMYWLFQKCHRKAVMHQMKRAVGVRVSDGEWSRRNKGLLYLTPTLRGL